MAITIGLTYDLRNEYLKKGFKEEEVAEFDSESTIDHLESAIKSLGYKVKRIGNAFNLCSRLANGEKWDLIFNIAEGLRGRSREAQVPAILELYNIPYTFSDPLVCAITLDKGVTKKILQQTDINTGEFCVVKQKEDIAKAKNLAFPLFAKPIAEGTGKGINKNSKIINYQQLEKTCLKLLKRYKQPVMVEEYLPGREFTVGILGTNSKATILGTLEISPKKELGTQIYSFEMKEKCEQYVTYTKPKHDQLIDKVEKLALQAYQCLECRDAGRVDIRIDKKGEPIFMEINPLAGIHPTHSDLPMIATNEGIKYEVLIQTIIKSALNRLNSK